MLLKKIIFTLLTGSLLFTIYYFFFPGSHFPKTKSLIILNRSPLTGSESEFIIRVQDKIIIINDSSKIQHFNKIGKMRGNFIIKNKILGKAITVNNDTINIIISFPGGYVINQKDRKRYGFSAKDKQELLSAIFTNE